MTIRTPSQSQGLAAACGRAARSVGLLSWIAALLACGAGAAGSSEVAEAPGTEGLPDPDGLAWAHVLVCHGTYDHSVCPAVPMPLAWMPEGEAGWEALADTCTAGDERACWVRAFLRAAPWQRPEELGLDHDDWEANFGLLEGACERGEAVACNAVAAILDTGLGRPDRQPDAAGARWREGCEAGDPIACANSAAWVWRYLERLRPLAEEELRGLAAQGNGTAALLLVATINARGDEASAPEGMLLLDEGCQLGDQTACMLRALQRIIASSVETPTPAETWTSVELLCARGEARACHHIAIGRWHGDGLDEDREGAAELASRGCKAGFVPGCVQAAQMRYELDGDTPEVREHVFELLQIGCHLGSFAACHEVSVGLDLSPERQRDLMYRLCGSGHPGACERVSADLRDAQWQPRSELDWERFRAAFAQGCTAGVFSACGTLARLYVEGRFADSSEEVAVPLYEFACARAGARACHELGELHAAAGREQPAFEAWVHGCMELGHRPSCVDGAAWLQAQGAEPERVAPWLGAACELGETSACPADSP